ncbi:MAG TPA: exopolysaccharide biosynthesis protein [Terrisporobacter glycolicus]|uniref:DUF1919 domain-containing protein n=1 Tax=Terrisporobacter TaxID=1505652 RepID=UPI000E8BDA39|nr:MULTISPECIES: DUF1919 domain-containing protein [Terrisporobacter]HBI93588.1 exopolysaccharide biosynthesis protein [Terrisporobacter hibernicus]
MIQKYIKKIKNRLWLRKWNSEHIQVKNDYRARYCGKTPTIISHNCIGGVLSHELGLRFLSPTVNLFMVNEDFIKFCENLEYYLSLEITHYDGKIKREYPLGKCGDLVLYFVHYNSFEDARKKWEERKQRINMNNIYIIATDRDNFNKGLLQRFKRLPYRNKKLFSHLPIENSDDVVYIKGFENHSQIDPLTNKVDGGRYLIDQFDWVSWLNG